MQNSGEYKALCYQALNIARWRVDALKKQKKDKRPRAIITDVDETVLDNSYFGAQLVKDGNLYAFDLWKKWTDKSEATAIPGALAFLQYASEKGITIFYVSNRKTSEVSSTVENLKELHFPNADPSHMLFQDDTSSKEARRNSILEKYNVIMLIGDNLNDFAKAFEGQSNDQRSAEVSNTEVQWGKKFIILPNPSYGDWESATFNYQRGLSEQEKQRMMFESLKGYDR
jgi:5'-nucleotidase (lipoprotein e(P4) family)